MGNSNFTGCVEPPSSESEMSIFFIVDVIEVVDVTLHLEDASAEVGEKFNASVDEGSVAVRHTRRDVGNAGNIVGDILACQVGVAMEDR